ncbi:hypothetical protein Ahy_A02g005050 isoform A [Arachis hypogaea]|uniref:Uncharacterized protein n=1 Tax=Arachis hypogaea TaxID=3818 RepID=A0A445E5N3_ARAHY|nr:hypothetical protein Ahy_A02g005050 isoform A [Arachis hypogaea]
MEEGSPHLAYYILLLETDFMMIQHFKTGIVESWEHFLLALYIEHSLLGQRMKEMNLERAIIYGWKELDVIIDALGKMMIDELSEVIIKILHGWKEIGV